MFVRWCRACPCRRARLWSQAHHGSQLQLEDGPRLLLLADELRAYRQISALITRGRRRLEKGAYRLTTKDVESEMQHGLAIWLPGDADDDAHARWFAAVFPNAPGSRWNCSTRVMTAHCSRGSGNCPGITPCRSSPPATCTCIAAHGGRYWIRCLRYARVPPSPASVRVCLPTASAICVRAIVLPGSIRARCSMKR